MILSKLSRAARPTGGNAEPSRSGLLPHIWPGILPTFSCSVVGERQCPVRSECDAFAFPPGSHPWPLGHNSRNDACRRGHTSQRTSWPCPNPSVPLPSCTGKSRPSGSWRPQSEVVRRRARPFPGATLLTLASLWARLAGMYVQAANCSSPMIRLLRVTITVLVIVLEVVQQIVGGVTDLVANDPAVADLAR